MEAPLNTSRAPWMRWGIVAGISILYPILFPFLHGWLGDSAAAFSAIPVAAVGWYLGLWWGLASALGGIVVSAILFIRYFNYSLYEAFPPGVIMLLFVGGMAGYLHNVWEHRNQVESELRARERFLIALDEITTNILKSNSPTGVLSKLVFDLVALFEADACFITRWDASNQQAKLVASTNPDLTNEAFECKSEEPNLNSTVLQSGRAIGVDSISSSPFVSQLLQSRLNLTSLLAIPLKVLGYDLGVIILGYKRPRAITQTELRYAEQAGSLLALAIWDVQQDTELQRRLHASDALSKIERALSETERVGLDDVLQLIVDSAQELIPASERAVIHLLDEDHQFLIPRAVTGGEQSDASKVNMRLGEGVAGQVIAEGVSVNIGNIETDPRFLRQGDLPHFRSLMVAPVQSGDNRLGTISVQSSRIQAFSDNEMNLLDSLGVQASLAIENARLLEKTQQSLKEVNSLYHITQGLTASLDTETLMKEVVELLQQNFGFYQVQILVIDHATEELVMQYGSGKIGKMLTGFRLPAGQGIVGYAVETGKPFFTNDVDQVVFYVRHELLPDTHAELAVPIKVNYRVVAVLDVQAAPPVRLTERDLQLVTAVADQLAVALQKASLYSDLQASLALEKSMRSQLIQSERLALVGRLLASVSHELNNPLQAIQNALFLLQEEKGLSPQGRQDLQIVLSEAERMAGLIDRLRTSYRSTRVEDLQPVHINGVVEDVHALMATHLRHNNIAFEFHPDIDLPLVAGLPDQIRQVILNLLMNGVEAMPSGGRLMVSTELLENGEVLLTVSDTGPGIDPELLPHIFDAFVTNKDSGTGLGLTITYDIIQRHNGRITAENNPDRGATFKIWFPAHAQEEIS